MARQKAEQESERRGRSRSEVPHEDDASGSNTKSHEMTPGDDYWRSRRAAWDQGFVGPPTNVDARDDKESSKAPGLSARRQGDSNSQCLPPTQIDIYSHCDDSRCCWYKYCQSESDDRVLRLDVRPFYDPNNHQHDGRHQDVQAGLLRTDSTQPAPKLFIELCKSVRKHLKVCAGRECVITFWCHRGKHRSVGCAELFTSILSTEPWARAAAGPHGCPVYTEHVSLDHHRHGCKERCNNCVAKSPFLNPNLLKAREVWDRSAEPEP